MTSVTFTPDVGGDNITIDDTDSATTGLANGGHRTRFMIALQQFMKVVVWVKATAATVLGYRDAAATSASQAQTYAGAAQAAAGVPSYAAKQNYVFVVNSGATGVQWSNALSIASLATSGNITAGGTITATGAISGDTMAAKSATYTHTAPSVTLVESDQAGAVGAFRMLAEGGALRIDRNTATARDFSTQVTECQVNSAGRHLYGGVADNTVDKFQYGGDVAITGTLKASVNIVWTSDASVKTDVRTLDGALDQVERMRGVRYRRCDLEDGRDYVGVIAQELCEILPEAVREGPDGLLAVDYGAIGPVLIEAVKELAGRVRQLEGARA